MSNQHKNPTVEVLNLIDGSSLVDRLYQTSTPNPTCSIKACIGSILDPHKGVSYSTTDSQFEDVKTFFQEFYQSKKRAGSEEHLSRVAQAEFDLRSHGIYTHTVEELEFGAKTAWRNAPKCIGRMQWKNLKMFDGRHAKEASEMFEILMKHLKYATNGGNLRPAVTIFPPKVEGHEYRCVNPQIIQYAGYRKGNKIIGDPANADLTMLLQRLGWRGKGGRFDVLPLLLQADGKEPEWFEIPQDLILEVDITHPELDCFKDLNLKWYAVPAVSSLRLDLGGLEYTGCPFNGWYMGSEVAARDFCDEQRLNLLPVIAKAMGLDTNRNSTLWKDRALVEINVAVLHSYQKARVTMTDHHTASESFMEHYASEVATRGGCPSDWVWIVPPLSGSACPVFHQEMVRYTLKPSYEYQVKPWAYDRYGKPCLWSQKEKSDLININVRFSSIVRCIMWLLELGKKKKKYVELPYVSIIYGTETGRSLTFAKQMAKSLKRKGCVATVTSMYDYDVTNLKGVSHLLAITSTFGAGDPPEEAREFWQSLQALDNPELQNMKYSVLALGSTLYPDFCQFGKDLDHRLSEFGATRMCKAHEADEMKGQDSVFKKWSNSVLNYITGKEEEKTVFRCRFIHHKPIMPSKKMLSILHDASVELAPVESVQELQSKGNLPRYFDVQFQSEDETKPNFEAGDHLQIHPGNRDNHVQMVLKKLKVTPQQHTQPLLLEYFDTETKEWLPDERFPEAVSLKQLLTWFLDIMAPVSEEFIHELKVLTNNNHNGFVPNAVSNGKPKGTLVKAMNGKESYEPMSYLEVFQMAKPNSIPPDVVISYISIIKPRKYSISTDPLYEKCRYAVTFKEIVFKRNEIQGNGLATGYMTDIPIGHKVHVSISRPLNFHLSMAGTKPILMIAQGTGISPFRAFWRHKYAHRQSKSTTERIGPLHLFYGCRNQDIDLLYKKEIANMMSLGTLDTVSMAYSRDNSMAKTYVQHLITQNTSHVGNIVHAQGGFVFYCGDLGNWDEICTLLTGVIEQFANITPQAADQYVNIMKQTNRLTRDIFMD